MGYDDRDNPCGGTGDLYFIGVAGVGMSPLAQYFADKQKVYGSDRSFSKADNENQDYKELTRAGVVCLPQDGKHIPESITRVIASAAVEKTNPDFSEAERRGISTVERSDLLAEEVSRYRNAICVAGTAGKSSTTLMIYHLLHEACLRGYTSKDNDPRMIAGAALRNEKINGRSGNMVNNTTGPLIFEADESDGSVVKYHPRITVLTNIGHDHHEPEVTFGMFSQLDSQTSDLTIYNSTDSLLRNINKRGSAHRYSEFGSSSDDMKICQTREGVRFEIEGVGFEYKGIGLHNAYNIAAAVSVGKEFGISVVQSSDIFRDFGGVYRRGNIISSNNDDVLIVDDFAHTPEEIAETIRTLASCSNRVHAIYQPHGFGPLKKAYQTIGELLKTVLRPQDKFYLLDVYYEGGTADMSINSAIVSEYLVSLGLSCEYVSNKDSLPEIIKQNILKGDSVVVMGARDKKLGEYAQKFV